MDANIGDSTVSFKLEAVQNVASLALMRMPFISQEACVVHGVWRATHLLNWTPRASVEVTETSHHLAMDPIGLSACTVDWLHLCRKNLDVV